MAINSRALPVVAASAILWTSLAYAGGPLVLTDGQLDSVAAGSGFATANAAGQGTGLYVEGAAGTFTVVTGGSDSGSPWSGSAALSSGTSGIAATNVTLPGSATTSVTTNAAVPGNYIQETTLNHTTTVNGMSITVAFTYVAGGFVPGMF